jgi:hypothetical protein
VNFSPLPLRYGTTSFIFPPAEVLNTQLLGNSPSGIQQALSSTEPPKIIVLPRDTFPTTVSYEENSQKTKELLQEMGLWNI